MATKFKPLTKLKSEKLRELTCEELNNVNGGVTGGSGDVYDMASSYGGEQSYGGYDGGSGWESASNSDFGSGYDGGSEFG